MLLRTVREAIALALGGRAAARLTETQAIGLGKDAPLRLIQALPDPKPAPVRVLGVDDFALKRGSVYGTVLVDIEGRRPVDVLPERSAESLADWLTAHPGAEIICHDRARYYAEDADRGAGTATQVADRFHLCKNLGDATERLVKRLRPHWTSPSPEKQPATLPEKPEGPRTRQTRERHAAVHALMAKGINHTGIVAELRLEPKTVRKFMRADSPARDAKVRLRAAGRPRSRARRPGRRATGGRPRRARAAGGRHAGRGSPVARSGRASRPRP